MVQAALGAISGDAMLARIVMYQAVGQLLSGALEPYARAFSYLVNARTPNAELTPYEWAQLVERTFKSEGEGAAAAAKFGIEPGRFADMVRLAAISPPPEFLAVALRRGIISEDDGNPDGTSFHAGIAQGSIGTKWESVIREMATSIPTPELALDALLEGQTSEAEARELFARFGGDPAYFQLAYNTRGSAPTPVEAGVLANRGIIPWSGSGPGVVSFEQAFLEGPWRNKWLAPMQEYAKYRPPPRTVTALLRAGSITDEQAAQAFHDYGLTPEWAAIYVRDGHTERKAAAHSLARTTIERLYVDRIVTRDQAAEMLLSEGWDTADANYLLAVVDLANVHATANAVLTRIRTLYAGYKINRPQAIESLTALSITGERQSDLLELWEVQRVAQMRQLTPAEITNAQKAQIINGSEARRLLEELGYSSHDAWILQSLRDKATAGAEPARGVPGGAPGIQT